MAIEALRDIQRASISAFTVGGGGSAASTQVEVNLGSVGVRSGRFTITDAAILVTDKLLILTAPSPYTGKGALDDESELAGPISFVAKANAGTASVRWSSPFLQRGNVKIYYLRS